MAKSSATIDEQAELIRSQCFEHSKTKPLRISPLKAEHRFQAEAAEPGCHITAAAIYRDHHCQGLRVWVLKMTRAYFYIMYLDDWRRQSWLRTTIPCVIQVFDRTWKRWTHYSEMSLALTDLPWDSNLHGCKGDSNLLLLEYLRKSLFW